jgi:uncharacterized membrane protein YkoI
MQIMNKFIIATVFAAALALPAAGQSTNISYRKLQPTNSAVRVQMKVDRSLARTARVSADQAFAIARANANNGEVASAALETSDGRLIYNVQVLNGRNGESTVKIDALTGELFSAEKHGGLKSTELHHKESKKLQDAQRDSAARNP